MFKQIADRVGISERMSDYITGHAHRTIGAKYGAPTVEHMAAALAKFPRYEIAKCDWGNNGSNLWGSGITMTHHVP
jgi:hypothetical protein